MGNSNKLKIFNDPIYGFINLPNEFIFDLIQHPFFQRLRRISQMGLSYLVYPGAHHTRFHHAIGAMHIMSRAIDVLKSKGIQISKDEENALLAAILLHDIGHGPFSHAMEHSIVPSMDHESISLLFMEQLNIEFNGKLDVAIQIFKGQYPRKFMLQLVSSQLDMDRMDYLKRDSFYTGVAEGNINSDRLIQMMNVSDDVLVIEEKGIYSVEKFLMARRLMYWQVYLHKTSLGAEMLLTKVLQRAKELMRNGAEVDCPQNLKFFLLSDITIENFTADVLQRFSSLDDVDILSAIKNWTNAEDAVLRDLSLMVINRDLLKVRLSDEKFPKQLLNDYLAQLSKDRNCSLHEASYFVFKGKIWNQVYNKQMEPVRIIMKDGSVEDVIDRPDQPSLRALSKPITKYYMCVPKHLV
ncbi:HD domain-containing protein [Flavobacterium silvaticum]|uniref:HD domain-containing protein n=1 Tax=Flavobacterium silvaticum TaxID=1852020 RepID=A0A972JGA4_9FLAO|nr:HD domain-containing protein [Flavobacterium silvaticum]NMH28844.1 HD domain-containing protein [Flavobacterium silvaticum]